MKNLKCYIGLDNRFVMCEKFPDDEEHAGLNEMLKEFVDQDVYIADKPLNQGFYNIEFDFDYTGSGDSVEEFLVVKKLVKINNMEILRTQNVLLVNGI